MRTRAEAQQILTDGMRQIRELLDDLPEPSLIEPRTIGGGDWSAKDLVAHLTFWERNAIDAMVAWSTGAVAPVDRMLRAPGVSAINVAAMEATHSMSWTEVHSLSIGTHAELVDRIQATSNARWLAPPTRRGKRSLGERLGSILAGRRDESFDHVSAHLDDAKGFADRVVGHIPHTM